MDKARVFFSFHVPASVGTILHRDIAALSVEAYPLENLHVTLRFIADVSAEEQVALIALGEKLRVNHGPISFRSGHFSLQGGRMRLLVDGGQPLTSLHAHLVRELGLLHIGKPDSRPYEPHITLARLTHMPSSLSEPRDTYTFRKTSFGLYKSEQGTNQMGVYTLLKEFELLK